MNRPPKSIQREITPLSQSDCFLVFDRVKSKFDFPVHFHPEYELNFIYQLLFAADFTTSRILTGFSERAKDIPRASIERIYRELSG